MALGTPLGVPWCLLELSSRLFELIPVAGALELDGQNFCQGLSQMVGQIVGRNLLYRGLPLMCEPQLSLWQFP